jgi:hypothetical protein
MSALVRCRTDLKPLWGDPQATKDADKVIQYHEDFVATICTWLVWIELQFANLCDC